jgi:hypothetical protein
MPNLESQVRDNRLCELANATGTVVRRPWTKMAAVAEHAISPELQRSRAVCLSGWGSLNVPHRVSVISTQSVAS